MKRFEYTVEVPSDDIGFFENMINNSMGYMILGKKEIVPPLPKLPNKSSAIVSVNGVRYVKKSNRDVDSAVWCRVVGDKQVRADELAKMAADYGDLHIIFEGED